MINTSSSSVGTCRVSSSSLSEGERRVRDVQGIDKKIASIRSRTGSHYSKKLIPLVVRRRKKMRKLVQLKKTKLDKNIQTNRENKIARINKLKNDINKEIRNYDDLGFPNPPTPTPTHMIPRVTIRRPEPAGSNPPTPTHGIPRETSTPPKEYDTAGFPKQRPTKTRVASPPPKEYDTDGFPKQRPTKTRAASSPPKGYDTAGFPKQRPTKTRVASPPPKTNKASGKADSIILEIIALKSELATLKNNANGSSHGHKDYEAKAPLLKKQIKELQNEFASTPAPKAPPKTNKASGKADSIILEIIALKSELATLKNNANGSSHGHKDYEAKAPLLKKQIKELQNEFA